jgi:hypothetical protein
MKKICFLIAFSFIMGYSSTGFCLTPEEIIKLKDAGVSDETIQIMLEHEKQGVREIRDDKGHSYIIYSTGSSSTCVKKDKEEADKVERAWRILEHVIIDGRQ